MSSITPTIGRKVWLWMPSTNSVQDSRQAFDASICCVGPNNQINVTYANHWGTMGSLTQLEIRDYADTDCHGKETVPYCTWMPYQMGQAKKAFEEAKREESGG